MRCNSGSLAINGDGRPMIFYTFVPFADGKRPREQWAAHVAASGPLAA